MARETGALQSLQPSFFGAAMFDLIDYDEYFSRQYGFWQPYVKQVIYRYLDCGELQ